MFLFFDALNEQAITNCCVRFIRIHTIVYRNFTWFSCVRGWQWQLQFVSATLSSAHLCHDSDLVSYTHSPHTHSIHSEVKFKCLNWNTANNVLIGIFCCGIQVYWGNFGIFFKGFGVLAITIQLAQVNIKSHEKPTDFHDLVFVYSAFNLVRMLCERALLMYAYRTACDIVSACSFSLILIRMCVCVVVRKNLKVVTVFCCCCFCKRALHTPTPFMWVHRSLPAPLLWHAIEKLSFDLLDILTFWMSITDGVMRFNE